MRCGTRGQALGHGRQRYHAVGGRQRRRPVGFEFGNQNDVSNVKTGQHQARKKCTGVELHHRYAGRRTIDNKQDRGRDQNSQAAAGGDGARGQRHAVAGPQHGGQRQQTHQGDDSTDDTCSRCKNSAGHQRGHRQRARDSGHRQMQAFKQFFNQIGALDQVAHENEQGNRDQHIAGHGLVRGLDHQVQGPGGVLVVSQPGKNHAHAHQRERGRKAQHDGRNHQRKHQQAQMTIGDFLHAEQHGTGAYDDQSHEYQPEIQFFADLHLLMPFKCMSCSSLAMSSSLTWTIFFSCSTSTSATSRSRVAHAPV